MHEHEKLVSTLNYKTPNEHFNFEESPFYVNTELKDWESGKETPRRAGVSAFGYSGTNAHMVIEEYKPKNKNQGYHAQLGSTVLIVLSAKSEEQLKIYAENMKNWVESQKEINLSDMAYTLQTGREEMEYRLAFPAETKESIIKAFDSFISGKPNADAMVGEVKKNKEMISALSIDEDMAKTIDAWIEKKKYGKLLDLWVKGFKIQWEKLYSNGNPYRISLPGYPFAKERYWITQTETRKEPEIKVQEEVRRVGKAILVKEWERKEIKSGNNYKPAGVVVVLGAASSLKLAGKIFKGEKDIEVIPVIQGNKRKKGMIAADFYSEPAGEKLYKEIKEKHGKRRLLGVVDMTALDKEYEESLEIESGKIKFLQKLIENDRNEGYKLLQAAYRLNSFQIHKPAMQGARTAGLYRMLGAEYKSVESMTMDCDDVKDESQIVKQIEKEFTNRSRENLTECCYRNGERYEPRMAIGKREEEMSGEAIPERYEKDEAVLITGGTRGIGAAIAGCLVSKGVKNLVLMGREELPGEEEWKKILEKGERKEIREKIKRMQEYREKGVNVLYYHTDLTDEEGLKKMAEEIRRKAGKITGVFHCAGLLSGNPGFYKKEMKEMEAVCVPKIKGMATLHKVLEREPLSYYILFSSISSVVPVLSAGQSDYAMANGYMDYYAMKEAGEGKRYIQSVQWPGWGETGMASEMGGKQTPAYEDTGFTYLKTEEGLSLLENVMKASFTVSAPCVIIPEEFKIEELLKKEIKHRVKKTAEHSRKIETRIQPPALTGKGKDIKAAVDLWIKGILIKELKLTESQVDEERPFDEYGVDSIVIAQMVQALQKEMSKPVSPAVFLENRTISELSKYFISNHADDLMSVLNMESGISIENPGETVNSFAEEERIEKDEREIQAGEEIAVVGIACRFPGAADKEAYWGLLTRGESAIRPVPESRWQRRDNQIDYGGWIDDIELFDPEFFKLKDNDAAIMDPQARIILEESLKVIYDAGYDHNDLSGRKIGVYIGGRSQFNGDMKNVLEANNPILGVGQNYLASNISRTFNFTGPSMVVDTACSSGLTAISMASDALKAGRIDMAMAGAVNLILNPYTHEMFEARNILSRNGEFHIFDKRSGGEVLGEGAGVVILKRLSDAVRDGNKIYGVIKAIAMNNDGRTLGPGSPNINAQKRVIGEALKLSGKSMEEIGYIEVNGGGTPVVDSIEIKALSEMYQLSNMGLRQCALGSIKPNIGHLLLTAGLAGFIRCMLSLYYKRIPPFLSAEEPVEYYDFKGSRVWFNRGVAEWEAETGKKRTAAQNSFPDGGTNCHIVMEEFEGEGKYEQRLHSIPIPEMNKISFAHTPVVLPGRIKPALNNEGNNISDFKNQFKKIKDRETKSNTSFQKFWGELK